MMAERTKFLLSVMFSFTFIGAQVQAFVPPSLNDVSKHFDGRTFLKSANAKTGGTTTAAATTTTTTTTISSSTTSLWDAELLDDYAERTGVTISLSTLGPGYRAVARAKHDESLILGYVEGFIRPAGKILHLDKMEIFQPMVKKAKQQVPESFDFGGISFGVGLVLGYRCLLYAKEKGCSIAEFLAIDDEEFQHKRLVRYYKRVGFKVVKYVGDDLQDIPARMVWGGCGTLMKEEIDILMQKWAGLLTLMDERAEKERES